MIDILRRVTPPPFFLTMPGRWATAQQFLLCLIVAYPTEKVKVRKAAAPYFPRSTGAARHAPRATVFTNDGPQKQKGRRRAAPGSHAGQTPQGGKKERGRSAKTAENTAERKAPASSDAGAKHLICLVVRFRNIRHIRPGRGGRVTETPAVPLPSRSQVRSARL